MGQTLTIMTIGSTETNGDKKDQIYLTKDSFNDIRRNNKNLRGCELVSIEDTSKKTDRRY